jgi:hypothetical protein
MLAEIKYRNSQTIVDAVFHAVMIVLPLAFRSNSLHMLLRPDIMLSFGRMLGRVSVPGLTGSDEAGFSRFHQI